MILIQKIKSIIKKYLKPFHYDITSIQPKYILPDGFTIKQIYDFVLSVSVENGPKDELKNYATHDFYRFIYTYNLLFNEEGKCLELGSNPYFTTMLLKKFTTLIAARALE